MFKIKPFKDKQFYLSYHTSVLKIHFEYDFKIKRGIHISRAFINHLLWFAIAFPVRSAMIKTVYLPCIVLYNVARWKLLNRINITNTLISSIIKGERIFFCLFKIFIRKNRNNFLKDICFYFFNCKLWLEK